MIRARTRKIFTTDQRGAKGFRRVSGPKPDVGRVSSFPRPAAHVRREEPETIRDRTSLRELRGNAAKTRTSNIPEYHYVSEGPALNRENGSTLTNGPESWIAGFCPTSQGPWAGQRDYRQRQTNAGREFLESNDYNHNDFQRRFD